MKSAIKSEIRKCLSIAIFEVTSAYWDLLTGSGYRSLPKPHSLKNFTLNGTCQTKKKCLKYPLENASRILRKPRFNPNSEMVKAVILVWYFAAFSNISLETFVLNLVFLTHTFPTPDTGQRGISNFQISGQSLMKW